MDADFASCLFDPSSDGWPPLAPRVLASDRLANDTGDIRIMHRIGGRGRSPRVRAVPSGE